MCVCVTLRDIHNAYPSLIYGFVQRSVVQKSKRMNRNLIKISKFRSISALYLQRSQIHYSYSFEKEKMPTAVNMQQPRFLVSLDPEHPHAKAPTRGSALAAGYDLYASQNVIIPKGGRIVVPTGIRVAIPEGSYGRVAPRSGLGECIYSSSLITNMVQFLT